MEAGWPRSCSKRFSASAPFSRVARSRQRHRQAVRGGGVERLHAQRFVEQPDRLGVLLLGEEHLRELHAAADVVGIDLEHALKARDRFVVAIVARARRAPARSARAATSGIACTAARASGAAASGWPA